MLEPELMKESLEKYQGSPESTLEEATAHFYDKYVTNKDLYLP